MEKTKITINDLVRAPGTATAEGYAYLFEDPEAATRDISGKVTAIHEIGPIPYDDGAPRSVKVMSSSDPEAIVTLDNDAFKRYRLKQIRG